MIPLKAKSILIVDDLADNLFLLQTLLESEGYTVEVAESGSTALEKVEAMLPDLMLLDVMMPDMTGYEVARQIRQSDRLSALPIVLITAHDESGAAKGREAGANDFIRKPIDVDELLSRVRCYAV